ncbi:MAG TPA: Nif3-like dinuclear metal center hexameric protein [Bryobacteraceae bacterium]|nr:Nif3-like dinuclear metal center hexameric protein [Bryobacteraceae bacterium]
MAAQVTAQQVVERIQKNLGVPWKTPSSDVFYAGMPETAVTGIVTTWTPSLEVLQRAAVAKKNLIIARESPYWLHETRTPEFSGAGGPFSREQMGGDPTYQFKRNFIAKNNLVIWRFFDNWNARRVDGQLHGLCAALGWDQFRKNANGPANYEYFTLPETSLAQLVATVQGRLRLRAPRILGDPKAQVRKVAVTHGFLLVPALAKVLEEPGVDVVITGEPVEWEASPYFDDWITAGKGKGMIILGSQVSEEPGSGEVATWLKTFIPEVPIEWIPAGEPFWAAGAGKITGGAR